MMMQARPFFFAGIVTAAVFFAVPFFAHSARAATLQMVPEESGATVGQPLRVDLVLDTQGDDANAVQASITFSPGIFSLQSIEDGNSIINFWISAPAAVSSDTVSLAGIVPGGYSGSSGVIATLVLDPLQAGNGTVAVSAGSVLRNDGQGSPISTTLAAENITVAPANPSAALTPPPASLVAPQAFIPVITSNPGIFGGKSFLVFSAVDTGTGIDNYQVLEVSTVPGGPVSGWHDAQSPYLLQDQSLASTIYVRAVDHAGNFIVVEVPAPHPWHGNSLTAVWPEYIEWIILVLMVLFLLWTFTRRRRKHSG